MPNLITLQDKKMIKRALSIFLVLPMSILLVSQEDNDAVEEVVTVGTKASIISAIDKQRESNLIVSVVDSDALGDFPDTTAAEAIRRLSGITVENDQGEGTFLIQLLLKQLEDYLA